MTPSCSPRRSLLVAAALATAAATAPHATAQQPDADALDRMIAYSQCIRDNGYAEFPDPDSNGRLTFQIGNPSAAPRFRAAQEACESLSPFGFSSGPPSPEEMERLVGFAQCVRDNGVADFPDPDAEGTFRLSSMPRATPDSPVMQAALQACRQAGGGARIMIGG